ncbi:hypothetical protein [uncultured Mediterranean phage]|nr:hypothetical protein [uncultured Mediterranean phage]
MSRADDFYASLSSTSRPRWEASRKLDKWNRVCADAIAVCADIEDLGFGGTADSYRAAFKEIAQFSDGADLLQDARWTLDNARHELEAIRKHVAAEERQHLTTTRYRLLLGGLTDRFTDDELEIL